MNYTFTLYDMIQIALLLAACYSCFKWGHNRGVGDTLDYLESEGVIEKENA